MADLTASWSMIAWGYDSCGIPYFAMFEDALGPSIDIFSRSDTGPSRETLQKLFGELRDLGNKELWDLVGHGAHAASPAAMRMRGMGVRVIGIDSPVTAVNKLHVRVDVRPASPATRNDRVRDQRNRLFSLF